MASSSPSPVDRALEGALQGGLTGALWGSLVALQDRLRYPGPSATRQVSKIVSLHVVGLATLLAVYNGASCASRLARETEDEEARDSVVDGMVGGFCAGFVTSIPLHARSMPRDFDTAAGVMRRVPRVAWTHCLQYGLGMSVVGATMHLFNQPPAEAQPRPRTMTLYATNASAVTRSIPQTPQHTKWRPTRIQLQSQERK
jgi:hypothetical protein